MLYLFSDLVFVLNENEFLFVVFQYVIFTARVRSTTGGYLLSLSVHHGWVGGGLPQPLVPGPFWGGGGIPQSCHWSCPKSCSRSCLMGEGARYPSLWSQVLSRGGVPQPPPRQETESWYTTDSTSLAVTQEDFLVSRVFISYWVLAQIWGVDICRPHPKDGGR